ncbi:MAG: hypothetical protein JNM67_11275 [Bacteroidetes bacterium]|nr:hypothetical protein [Bacteroidota bacterium]
MKKLFLIWIFAGGFFVQGQEVNKEFTKLLLDEQFNQADKNWSSTFNADNLFIAQNGYYELFRKSKKSGYYLFSNSAEEYSNYLLESVLVFNEHKNKKQSAGVVLMAQAETSGGVLIEINQKKEFRIMKISKDKQTPLVGNGNGWIKASNALTKGENLISVKTYDKVYDLYLNGQFVQSFTYIELNKGKVGIYVGPDSKVKFDYLRIFGEDKKDLVTLNSTDAKSMEESFTQIIVKLKDQINKKDKEIDDLRTKLKLCESGGNGGFKPSDTALIGQRNRLNNQVEELEIENENLKTQLANLEEELKSLREFKERIEKGNEDGDIIINLTNMVATQKSKIETMENENKSLNKENNDLFMETKELTKQLDKNTNELTSERAKNIRIQYEIDSLKRMIISLKDSLGKKNLDTSKSKTGAPVKELTDEEKLQQLIEKEREERRKKREEEEKERLRKEEEEKQNNGGGGG